MPIHKDDRLLWFIVGFGLFFAYRGITEQLNYVRKLTEITKDERTGKKLDQETEDAVSLETLSALAQSHNLELRNAAVRITCERFTNGQGIKKLCRDLAGNDPRRRDDALTTTWFLLNSKAVEDTKISQYFYSFDFLRPLTICLVNLLPEHKNNKSRSPQNPLQPSAIGRTSPVRPPNRPIAETKALKILCRIVEDVKYTALVAGLVSDWLSKYPFPCALPEHGGHRDMVLTMFQSWYEDDPLMNNVLGVFCTFSEGRRALSKAGYPIWGEDSVDGDDDFRFGDVDGDVVMHGGEETAGLRLVDSNGRRRVRPRVRTADSVEEQAVRRRRREAMVISDGGGPLGQDNIIQREESGHSLPVPMTTDEEEQLSRLQEEVDREDEEANILDDQQMEAILR